MMRKRSRQEAPYPCRYVSLLLHAVVHPAIFKIVTAACLFSPLCRFVSFCKSSLLMADIRPGLSKGFSQICRSANRNRQTLRSGKRFELCRDVGLSNALSLGLSLPRLAKDFENLAETRSLFSTSLDSSHAQKALSELMNFSTDSEP